MAEKRSETANISHDDTPARRNDSARQERGVSRRMPQSPFMNPFSLLGRMVEEMNGVFDDAWSSSARPESGALTSRSGGWAPNVDVFQRGNELVVRADLPGMNPDDITVEVSDDAITLSGERQEEHRDDRSGFYRVERSYGSFYRAIPLPDGAITDQAKANFKHGVLEITVPAPPEQVSRGRRLEISRGEERAGSREASSQRQATSK